jgi:hypothetical protein
MRPIPSPAQKLPFLSKSQCHYSDGIPSGKKRIEGHRKEKKKGTTKFRKGEKEKCSFCGKGRKE